MGEEKDVSVTIYDHAKQPEIWKFQQLEDKKYHLIHTDSEGRQAAFEAFVIRLGKNYFIDFSNRHAIGSSEQHQWNF